MAVTKIVGSRQIAAASITNTEQAFGTPIIGTDVAIKSYVDSIAQGLSTKPSAVAATTAALSPANTYSAGVLTASSNGILTVDGVSLVLNDYVLVKDEAAGLKNGLYKVTTAGTVGVPYVLTRTVEMDVSAEFNGAFIFVESGTVNAASGWVSTTLNPTVGTTSIVFTQFSGAGSLISGTGITITGNTVSIDTSVTVDKNTAQTLTNKTLTSPVLTTPDLGTPSTLVGTNITGTATSFTAGIAQGLKSATTTVSVASATAPTTGQALVATSSSTATWQTLAGTGDALTTNPLSQFAATTSLQLKGVISDETGSGALVFANTPTLITPNITTSATVANNLAANIDGDGLVLTNTGTASSGNQIRSPRVRLTGAGWKTAATAASQVVDWAIENIPQQGSSSPSTILSFQRQINGGGFSEVVTFNSQGGIYTLGDVSATTINQGTLGIIGATFGVAFGKTVNINNSIDFQGTDSTTMTFPASNGTVATTNLNQTVSGVNTFVSTIVGSINGNAATVTTNANMTGDVTSSGSNATTIATEAVSLNKMASLAANSIIGNNTGSGATPIALTTTQVKTLLGLTIGTNIQAWDTDLDAIAALSASNDDFIQRKAGVWTNRTVAQVKTDLGVSGTISGTNTGDQTITLTGAVTGSGTGSFATTIATPGTLSASSTNSTATAHTHAITSSSAPGAAASLLATDASGIIGSTGTRIVKGWFVDLTVTNAITGSVTGNAATVTTNANLTGDVTSSGNATTIAVYSRDAGASGTQDSSNKVFTIGHAVKSGSEQIYVNGVLMFPGSSNDYVISGTTVTFQSGFTAPASTDNLRFYGVW